MSSSEVEQDKMVQAKRIFLNYVDSYQGKNFAKVCFRTQVQNANYWIITFRWVIDRWNQLDQGAVDTASVNAFKSELDRLRCTTRMGFFMD